MKFRDTEFFAENVKLLMEGCDGLEMVCLISSSVVYRVVD